VTGTWLSRGCIAFTKRQSGASSMLRRPGGGLDRRQVLQDRAAPHHRRREDNQATGASALDPHAHEGSPQCGGYVGFGCDIAV
jgi:hypothetical protein